MCWILKSVAQVLKSDFGIEEVVAAKKPAAVKTVSKPYTKSQVMTYLAGQAGISKKQAVDVYEALTGLVAAHLKSKKAFLSLM